LLAEGAVLHAWHISDEITQFLLDRFGVGRVPALLASLGDESLHFIGEQRSSPAPKAFLVVGMFFAAQQCLQNFACSRAW
jgi:hypothetical protein